MTKGSMADLESVISSSISSLPGSDASSSSSSITSDTTPDTPSGDSMVMDDPAVADSTPPAADAAVTPPPAADAPPAPPVVPEDTLDSLKAELAGKRDNRIPYSRVTKIVEKAVETAKAAARAEVEAQVAHYRTPEFQNGLTAMRVADENPQQFLAALAQADSRYADLLAGSKLLGSPAATPGRAQAKTSEPVVEGDVEPDIQLSDGTLGYSADAIRKLRAQDSARMEQLLNEKLKKFEPIEQDHRINRLRTEAATVVSAKIASAEKWPGFAEAKNEMAAAISAATQRGERLSLEEAYIQVAIPKMQQKYTTDEAAVRARVVADMNRVAAGATRVAPSAPAADASAGSSEGMDPIEAAIRASINKR